MAGIATRLAAILLLAVMPAAAHDAPMGWSYDPECCSGLDCFPVDDGHIQEVEGGFRVTLPPGSHPKVKTRPVTVLVPHNDNRIRKSGDWRKHACVSPSGNVLCIYLPPGGV